MADKQKDDIKIVAFLEVGKVGGAYTRVRQFDKAWATAQEMAQLFGPTVYIRLLGFVRKDVIKDEFVIRY